MRRGAPSGCRNREAEKSKKRFFLHCELGRPASKPPWIFEPSMLFCVVSDFGLLGEARFASVAA